MGLMDKIAPGHSEKKAEKKAEKEYEKENKHSSEHGRSSYEDPNSRRGNGMTGGGMGGSGNETDPYRNPIQHAEGRGQGGQWPHSDLSGIGSQNKVPSNYPNNDGYGNQSGSNKTLPKEPMDPYSSKGQAAAAAAAHHDQRGQGYEGMGSQAGGRGYAGNDSDVGRSRQGGVMNDMSNEGYGRGDETGRSAHRENHHAIPTAGGEKLGSGGNGDYSDRRQFGGEGERHHGSGRDHHYGRDAAGAGAVGAAGAGAYEMEKGRHGHHDRQDPSMDSRGQQGQGSSHHYGRDAAGAGALGAAGTGAYEMEKGRHGHHGRQDQSMENRGHQSQGMSNEPYGQAVTGDSGRYQQSGTGMGAGGMGGEGIGQSERPGEPQRLPTEQKMGGAYEAGYRDAMKHMQGQR